MKMENVIVTGGTGFLGRNIVRRLVAEGYRVYALVRPNSRNIDALPHHENVVIIPFPLQELANCEELPGRPYSAFYHFAWGGVNRKELDDESVQQRSLDDSIAALKAAAGLGCTCFLFSGSRREYGRIQGPYQEDADCHPMVAYGRAKLAFGEKARALCARNGMRYLHGRIFSVYGADDHPWSLIYTAITRMLRDEPIDLSSCTQLWNFMDVRDMADLFLTFHRKCERLDPGESGIFNVATRDIRPLREYVEEMYQITGSHSELRFGAFQQATESAVSLLPDMSKVENTFGWKSRIAFSEGIRDVIQALEKTNA